MRTNLELFLADSLKRALNWFYFRQAVESSVSLAPDDITMIRISKKGDYAVFLMGYLAQHGSADSVVSAQEIADRSGIAKSVVANLLKDLTRAGLLDSTRGIRGGYRLARAAESISLGDILAVVEGPFALVDCAQDSGPDAAIHSHCDLATFCPSKRPMRILHSRIANLLDDLKLPELTGEVGEFPAPASRPNSSQPAPGSPNGNRTTSEPSPHAIP